MTQKMAKHPHNASRPDSRAVKRALANGDMEELHIVLNPRQRAFCLEYIVDFNGAAAATRAGYAPKNAAIQAHTLLRHAGISAYIDHISQSKQAKIISVDPDYVIQRVTEIISKEGSKDNDKLRALELLARHLGMFVDRTEISGPDGEAIKVEQQVKEDVESIKNRIARLASRGRAEPTTVTIL